MKSAYEWRPKICALTTNMHADNKYADKNMPL